MVLKQFLDVATCEAKNAFRVVCFQFCGLQLLGDKHWGGHTEISTICFAGCFDSHNIHTCTRMRFLWKSLVVMQPNWCIAVCWNAMLGAGPVWRRSFLCDDDGEAWLWNGSVWVHRDRILCHRVAGQLHFQTGRSSPLELKSKTDKLADSSASRLHHVPSENIYN